MRFEETIDKIWKVGDCGMRYLRVQGVFGKVEGGGMYFVEEIELRK